MEDASTPSSRLLSPLGPRHRTGVGLTYGDGKWFQSQSPDLEGPPGASVAARVSAVPEVTQPQKTSRGFALKSVDLQSLFSWS